jgi:hypothetical protein
MQKWEYCVVSQIHSSSKVYHPKANRITSKGFEPMKDFSYRAGLTEAAAVGQFIAQLGEEGWEMVGVGNTGEAYHCLYFKRLKG